MQGTTQMCHYWVSYIPMVTKTPTLKIFSSFQPSFLCLLSVSTCLRQILLTIPVPSPRLYEHIFIKLSKEKDSEMCPTSVFTQNRKQQTNKIIPLTAACKEPVPILGGCR